MTAAPSAYHYTSPPQTIGRNDWRIIVDDSRAIPGQRSTAFQFRRQHTDAWQSQRLWPSYNINDGMHLGLPRSVAGIYRQHADAIAAAIAGEPEPAADQWSLAL